MRFIAARWSNLALFQYAAPPALLTPYLPPGCTPDLGWEGQAFVSLVAFEFLNTRVLGIPWPGFRNFPEINLRAYVRHEPTGDRGVIFIRELVPQRFVAAMARLTYNEPYRAVPMRATTTHTDTRLTVEHHATIAGRDNVIRVTGQKPCAFTCETGVEHFFKEHRWGFNRSRSGKLIRYEVVHPAWQCYAIASWLLDWDFAATYGSQWAFLREQVPHSVVLAEGSDIEVRLWTK